MTIYVDGKRRLREIVAVFLRLGIIGFGGPLAHIGLMEDECVTRRQWLTRETFLEGLALCNLFPGPTSTQLTIYLGYMRAGLVGGVLSGTCFIFPAFLFVLVLAWAYMQYGTLPAIGALFVGIGPVVVAIIINTLFRSGKTALTTLSSWCIAGGACLLTLIPLLPPAINLLTILLVAGVIGMVLYGRAPPDVPASTTKSSQKSIAFVPFVEAKALLYYIAPGLPLLISLALVFLKIGFLMFGGGLVIAPLLQQELVDGHHWLTTKQLLDGLALGQLTPGPVTVVATFAGYAVAGFAGGVIATIAIFLPSFVLVLGFSPLVVRVRDIPLAKGFLKGITAGSLGAIAAAAIFLGRTAIVDWLTAAIALLCVVLLLRWNVNTLFLIAGAAIIGLLRMFLLG
ncbi:MAG: chromate efflux transporter [Ktedonobacteraceae bacterium]